MGLKAHLRKLLFSIDAVVGEASSCLNAERGTLRAICLHAVKEIAGPSEGLSPGFEIRLEELRVLVELLLRRGYRFITPSDVKRELDPRGTYFVMTFDDGYFTTSLAVDLLEQYGVPVTLFVCPYYLERQIAHWSDALYRGCEGERTPADSRRTLERQLRALPQSERERWLIGNFGQDCLKPIGDADRPLTAAELKRLWSAGHVEIGNHSWSHADLSHSSEPEIEKELELAQSYVEALTGVRPTSVAFPYGLYNETVVDVVRRMGFTSAFTTVNCRHLVRSLTTEHFTLVGRFGSWNDKRPFARQVLRLRYGSLFSDRFTGHPSVRLETGLS